uniref:NAD-dependent epimerase/dehydratase family protein n=1 Tax=Agathobacter sp. TaxID=2021311 RepID=UPI0040563253
MNLYNSKTYIKDLDSAISCSVNIQELKNKSIMVTGATGTIGSFLVDMFLRYNQTHDANVQIFASSRSLAKLQERFDVWKTDSLAYVEHDILSDVLFDYKADYIVHAAGNAYPAAFTKEPVETIIGNINGTNNLLKFAQKQGVKRFLYVSSGEVYGQGDLKLDSFDENYGGYVNPILSRSCYPNSKRTAETLCVSFGAEYGLDTVIVRPCHTYGPCMTQHDNRANVQFIKNGLEKKDIILKSSGTQMRSYCYIADCASAILTVLVKGNRCEAYNIANSEARVTIAGFAEAVAQVCDTKVIFENPNERDIADRTPIEKQVLDVSKLESLGWKGRFTVMEGIEHTLKIMQEN